MSTLGLKDFEILGLKARTVPPTQRYLLAGLAVGLCYFAGAKLGFALTFQPHPISVMWPPNAILLTALLLSPVRFWWIFLVAALPAHLAGEAESGVPLPMVLCWYISNSCEAVIGAAVTRAIIGDRVRLDRLRELGVFFVCGAALGAFLSSFLDAAFVAWNDWGNDSYWQVWRMRFFSNVFASTIIVPTIVAWERGDRSTAEIPVARWVEGLLLAIGLLAVSLSVFHWDRAGLGLMVVSLSAPVPFFLWATLRFGIRGASTSILAVAILAIWSSAHARGPFITGSAEQNALSIQTFFVLLAFTLVPLAALLKERESATEALRLSEEHYREVVECQTDLVFRSYPDTTLTFVNQECCRFFRRSREELIGRKFLDFIPPSVHERALCNIAQVIVHRRAACWEHQILLPDDNVGWQHWTNYPIASSDGHIREIQSIGTDITERKRAEEALRESEERYREVVETQVDLVFRYMPDTTLTFVNEAFCRFFGRLREQLVGRKVANLLSQPARAELLLLVDSMLATGKGAVWESALPSSNGAARWQQWTSFPILSAEGRVREIQVIGRDISDRKQAEGALQDLTHASRLALVGELTAMIAHEISQPLSAILTNVEVAQALVNRKDISLEELRAVLADIHSDDLRASEAVHRIRTLSKRRPLEMQYVSLNNLVKDVLRFVSGDVLRRRVKIQLHLEPDLPLTLGDPVHLQQVLLNLFVNAMDAMSDVPEGERILTISTEKSNDALLIAVRDTGRGIPPEVMTKVFNSFFSTRQGGIGLGLSIARSIVEKHRGRIWAENNPDRGLTVRFTLPQDQEPDGTASCQTSLSSDSAELR